MDYRLDDLGSTQFERMTQALLLGLYGPAVQVFGTGADGGRDGTFEGTIEPDAPDDDVRRGYHVFQVKFREVPGTADQNRLWLQAQARKELLEWAAPPSKRKGPLPEYIVFISNVGLSGHPGGGLNQVEDTIREVAAKYGWPLKGCAVWDRTKVSRLLDGNQSVRYAFNGLITPGDVLAALGDMTGLGKTVDAIQPVLKEQAGIELLTRGHVSLGEAGQVSNQKLALSDVAIDLPAEFPENPDPAKPTVAVLRHLLTFGDQVLRPSVTNDQVRHFLVMGGPGQGKTTVGRLLAQVYRASLLTDDPGLSPSARSAVDSTLARASAIGLQRPKHRRWPVRVDLAEYADRVGGGADLPLLRYIAEKISVQTDDEFKASHMRVWMREWPWLLVLDGFDEVVAVNAREHVVDAVVALLEIAHNENADLLVVAATRPQGYSDELPDSFRKMKLAELTAGQAVAYATRLTDLRMGDDADKPAVIERIEAASINELTRRLMRTPLQVMIISLLLERQAKPPQDRAGLFESYYEVIYDRERHKANHLATVLADHRPHIDAVHRSVGLALQMASEGVGDSEAVLTNDELTAVVEARLVDQGYEGAELNKLTGELLQAAKDRLVLIVAKAPGTVGFELRSIQEFMAARALIDASDDAVMERLKVAAPSAHWRNTWLLAVGSLYVTRQHQFERVLTMIRGLDAGDHLSLLVALGPRLAVDILDDGLATRSPKYRHLLVDHALEELRGVSLGARRLGEVLVEVGDADAVVRARIIAALESAWGAPIATLRRPRGRCWSASATTRRSGPSQRAPDRFAAA